MTALTQAMIAYHVWTLHGAHPAADNRQPALCALWQLCQDDQTRTGRRIKRALKMRARLVPIITDELKRLDITVDIDRWEAQKPIARFWDQGTLSRGLGQPN